MIGDLEFKIKINTIFAVSKNRSHGNSTIRHYGLDQVLMKNITKIRFLLTNGNILSP